MSLKGQLRKLGVEIRPTGEWRFDRVPSTRATAQEAAKVPLTDCRVWDALATMIPGTPANDDLGIVTGTYGTGAPYISSGDVKAGGCTRYTRFLLATPGVDLSGKTLGLVINAGMVTTIADTSATLDVSVYRLGAPSTDLCETDAVSINSLTAANKTFVITATDLTGADVLDIRLKVVVADSATATAVIAAINSIELSVS